MKGTWYFADDNSDTRKEHKFYFRLKDDVILEHCDVISKAKSVQEVSKQEKGQEACRFVYQLP